MLALIPFTINLIDNKTLINLKELLKKFTLITVRFANLMLLENTGHIIMT